MNGPVRALSFVGIGLVIHVVLCLLYVRTAGQEHVALQLDRAFLASDEPLRLLFVGDSHTRNAVDDQLLPGTMNLAVGGEHYLKTWYRLRWLLERSDREIETVVMPLETTSFTSWKADNFAPEHVWGRYVPLFEIGMRKKKVWSYAGKAMKARLFPYVGEIETVEQYATETAAFRTDPGLGRLGALPVPQQRKVAFDAAKRHFHGNDTDDPSLLWAWRSLLRYLEQEEIRVVFVTYPVTKEYAWTAERVGARTFVRDEIIPQIVADPDYVWLDFEDEYFDQNDLFFDADHLNTVGKAQFTATLARELQDLGVVHRRRPAR